MDGFPLSVARPSRVPIQEYEAWLASRLGPELAARRVRLECAAETAAHRILFSRIVDKTIPCFLRLSRLLPSGRANAARIEVSRNAVQIAGLPEALRGLTVLHLTDLHADISENAMWALTEAVADLSYDVCVITGDFRGRTFGPFDRSVEVIRDVIRAIRAPVLGVLGNHDTARIVPDLEAMGIEILMNKSAALTRGGGRLWIAGVDDPHYYRTDDLAAATLDVARGEPVILLAHSSERCAEAAELGVNLMLCGHTHGGQICLPGSIPILTSTTMPRRLASGHWLRGAMHGYTSRGVGTCTVEARFFCPPEVVLHTLIPA